MLNCKSGCSWFLKPKQREHGDAFKNKKRLSSTTHPKTRTKFRIFGYSVGEKCARALGCSLCLGGSKYNYYSGISDDANFKQNISMTTLKSSKIFMPLSVLAYLTDLTFRSRMSVLDEQTDRQTDRQTDVSLQVQATEFSILIPCKIVWAFFYLMT